MIFLNEILLMKLFKFYNLYFYQDKMTNEQ